MIIVGIKTMRGDHMIMLAVLSAASMLMLYYGSLMTPTEVYLPITPSTLRHSSPEPKVTTTSADANICCQAETPICKACHEGISVEEYLKKHPKITLLVINDKRHIKRYKENSLNLENYAKKNGYQFLEKSPESDSRCRDARSFFFRKHCVVYHHMVDNGISNDRWYFVLDGDNAVRNPNTNIRLEKFIKRDKDVIYYYRFHNNEIAAGNYAIKNTQWATKYLKGYYELHKTYFGFNFDNGALHFNLLPDKNACKQFYRNPMGSLPIYDKYVGCVHKHLQKAKFPLKNHIYVYPHGKAWTYDGWVIDYKWSNDTLMHHAMKRPPMKGYTYENGYASEKELKRLLEEKLVKVQKDRPLTGWKYTTNAWNVRENIVIVPMIYEHLKLFNEGLRKQLKNVPTVIYISGIGNKKCPVIDNHYVECNKEYKFKAIGLKKTFQYVAKKYPTNTLVTIMDADDMFNPCTLQQIDMFYRKYNPKLLFHSFSRTEITNTQCKDPKVTHDGVYIYDYARKTEGKRLHLFDHAHHGHITMYISVALAIDHKPIPRAGTDSQFMRDVIKKYGRNPDTIMFTNDIKTVYKKPSDGFLTTLKNNRKIMIGIPVRNRIGYIKFSSKIVKKYNNIDSKDIFIFDDFSDQYGEIELRKWYGKDIKYFRSKKHMGADANTRLLFEMFSKSDYDILVTLDSDLLMKNNWKEFVYKYIDKSGVLSLYHSAINHHKTLRCQNDICEKNSMGNAGAVMRKDIVQKMLINHNSREFDWGWVSYFKKKGIKMYVPRDSIIMHFGKIGQNNGCGTSEVARNFDRSDLPSWINNGLVFYFDKCNSPNKIQPKIRSIDNIKKYTLAKVSFFLHENDAYNRCVYKHRESLHRYSLFKEGAEVSWIKQLQNSPWRTYDKKNALLYIVNIFPGWNIRENHCQYTIPKHFGKKYIILSTDWKANLNNLCPRCTKIDLYGRIRTPMIPQIHRDANKIYYDKFEKLRLGGWLNRKNTFYFAGQIKHSEGINRDRTLIQKLFKKLHYPFVVTYETDEATKKALKPKPWVQSMTDTKYGIHAMGNLLASARLYDWLEVGSIPVIYGRNLYSILPGKYIPWNDITILLKREATADNLLNIATTPVARANKYIEKLNYYMPLILYTHKKSVVPEMVLTDSFEEIYGSCALLFYGLPIKFNEIVYPSVKKYIIDTNPACDIYVHTYNVSKIYQSMNQDANTDVHINEVYTMTDNVLITDVDNKNASHYLKYACGMKCNNKGYEMTDISLANMIKSWQSIEYVWNFANSKKLYDRIGIFRMNVEYKSPIVIDDKPAVVPEFHSWGGFNDRVFYGNHNMVKKWVYRFASIEDFVKTKSIKKNRLHPETFIKYLLRDVNVYKEKMCFNRVRNNGKKLNDC